MVNILIEKDLEDLGLEVHFVFKRTAKGNFPCDASDSFKKLGLTESDLEPDDLTVYLKAKAEGFMVLNGQDYIETLCTYKKGLVTIDFKARIDMDYLFDKYSSPDTKVFPKTFFNAKVETLVYHRKYGRGVIRFISKNLIDNPITVTFYKGFDHFTTHFMLDGRLSMEDEEPSLFIESSSH